jgi:hypothetical protein
VLSSIRRVKKGPGVVRSRPNDREDGIARSGATSTVGDVSAELREARKRIKLLEQAAIMRRAVGYLSRDVNPTKPSAAADASVTTGR